MDLYNDLCDAIEQALWATAVIDPDDSTIATFPDGRCETVQPQRIIDGIASRVLVVCQVHGMRF